MSTLSSGKSGSSHSFAVSLSPRAEDAFSSYGYTHRRTSTIAEPGQNAIYILLKPPISRTGTLPPTAAPSTSQKPLTSRDIPPVALTTIPHVEPLAFKNYLSQIGPLFDTLQRMKLEYENRGTQLFRQGTSTDKHEEFAPREKVKAGVSKRGQLAPTPLSTVPSIYFDEKFRLENPRTFDAVGEHAEVVRQPLSTIGNRNKDTDGFSANGDLQPARKALTTNAILQEKLSWYMDTIEIYLICSISKASTSFIAALGSLRELQAEVSHSVTKIQKLRGDLVHLDNAMIEHGFEIIRMKRRQDNLRKLGEAIMQLQCVLRGVSHCEELVDSGKLETAIQHISYVAQLVSGTLDPKIGSELCWFLPNSFTRLIDLRQLHVLEDPLQNIGQLRLRIWKGYEARLLHVLLCDLRQHVSSIPPRDTLSRWTDISKRTHSTLSTPAPMTTAEKLREELVPVLQGLGQSQYLAAASTTFREAVIREMKSLIRRHLPSSTDDDNESMVSAPTLTSGRRPSQQERSSILSRNLRALSPEDAHVFFVKVYCGVGEALRRLSVQIKVLLDITSGIKKSPSNVLTSSLSERCNLQEDMTQTLDMSSLLVQAVDKVESEMTKVLRVRTEQTVRLGPTEFLRYFTLNRLFINECEAISGHSGTALRGVVNKQTHDFIPLLHEVEKQKLAQKMETERWEPVNFKPQDALILERVVQSMTIDSSKDPALAVIDEEKFMLVDSAAFALRGIEQYLIPGIDPQTTAGLTNINTKHLSLTSQSLSFFITLIPYLRESIRRRPSITTSGLAEYDQLKRLFQDHRSSIHHKLINIMSFRATLYIREMEKIKWDDEDEIQRSVSPHMETLTKEALTLQRVLSKYLPGSSMSMIIGQVFESYREQWSKAFEDAVIRTENGKSRLLRDAELLQAKLDKTDGAEKLGTRMIDIVRAKQISSQPVSRNAPSSGDIPEESNSPSIVT
ncbi:hypothetical protein A7D00_5928 [Trichophyton violaceum]|uniref:Vacuolar protein sorting-associated protein 54 C-terminal domain-containing protein n=1 Tax=Trichophyton violaceum TaxID=34388 RepID=A0A178FC07_TRIVO|nr:hypothetical protein A7D00_5928 [Trichophyton violaceum]